MINLEPKKSKIWQVASGSFKRVYLPQIFSNVSNNSFSENIFFLIFGEC